MRTPAWQLSYSDLGGGEILYSTCPPPAFMLECLLLSIDMFGTSDVMQCIILQMNVAIELMQVSKSGSEAIFVSIKNGKQSFANPFSMLRLAV